MNRKISTLLALALMVTTGCAPTNNTEKATTSTSAPTTVKVSTHVQKNVKPWPGANEAGQIPIAMYHRIKPEKGDYDRSPDHFYSDLERLYKEGYRPISVDDYLSGKIDVPGGMTPVVITFDDGDKTQYTTRPGSLEPTPDCAVGIMERFRSEHPDFVPKAVFYLNAGNNPFGEPDKLKEKLKYLLLKGYVIGNHTFAHENLSSLTAEQVQDTVGKNASWYSNLAVGTPMNSLALPFGVRPKAADAKEKVVSGSCNGATYSNKGVFNVGWCPDRPVWDAAFKSTSIARIRCGDKIDELGFWLDWLKKHRDERYISDGNPNTVAVPEDQMVKVDKARLGGLSLVVAPAAK